MNEPSFRTEGSAGGESDGKTIGIDGKPMSPQDIYYNDSSHFCARFDRGQSKTLSREELNQLTSLQSVYSARDETQRQKAIESYKRYYNREPDQDPMSRMAQLEARLNKAMGDYEMARHSINSSEQLRVKDRIDLDVAPNDAGRRYRDDMKQAIAEIQRWRTMLEKEFPQIVETGKQADEAKWAQISSSEAFGTTQGDQILLFIYSSFERTPMLEGLAEASQGRIYERAKPLMIPSGVRVQILDQKSMTAPSSDNRAETKLDLTRIRIKAPGVKQLDGADLSSITFEGWVLSSHVKSDK